jgi:hypothetical protein
MGLALRAILYARGQIFAARNLHKTRPTRRKDFALETSLDMQAPHFERTAHEN